MIDDKPLVSGLVFQEVGLTAEQVMRSLLEGEKIKLIKAPKGVNFYLKDGQLQSSKISYLRGLPSAWFNPDIKFEIDD